MTPEHRWNTAVALSKQLAKKTTSLDTAILWAYNRIKTLDAFVLWANDRIKTLEEEVKKLEVDRSTKLDTSSRKCMETEIEQATGELLDRWASVFDISRNIGETDDELRKRVMEHLGFANLK